jgi:hypothetical protein
VNLQFWYQVITSIVFWTTVVSVVLALIDRWSLRWFAAYPASRVAHVIHIIEDLCNDIGNLFKARIAPPPSWDGVDRRE